jgi:hypothetical protein
MCSVRIAPALRVGDAFRAHPLGAIPRAEALGYSVLPLRGNHQVLARINHHSNTPVLRHIINPLAHEDHRYSSYHGHGSA